MSPIASLVLAFSWKDTCCLIPPRLPRSVASAILRTCNNNNPVALQPYRALAACRAWKFCLCSYDISSLKSPTFRTFYVVLNFPIKMTGFFPPNKVRSDSWSSLSKTRVYSENNWIMGRKTFFIRSYRPACNSWGQRSVRPGIMGYVGSALRHVYRPVWGVRNQTVLVKCEHTFFIFYTDTFTYGSTAVVNIVAASRQQLHTLLTRARPLCFSNVMGTRYLLIDIIDIYIL